MNALVFKPSGEPIGKFEITSIEELPEKLEQFLATGVRTPLRSYVEASGKAWTIAGLNPLNLREGPVARQLAQGQMAQHRQAETANREHARGQMFIGLALLVGGILFTLVSYFSAASTPGGGRYFVATGAMIFGAIRFFSNLARVISK